MPFKTSFLKRIALLTTILSLVIVCIFGVLTDTAVVDLTSGFSHPLEGWDHLVTMLAVGIWAAQLRGKAIWLLPLTFVGVMSLGGISGAAKYLAVPSAEVLIVLSSLVFSVLIILKIRFDTKINVLIVAFFAFFHGYAHGQEISASASLISYSVGFMVATLLLHGAGILVAKLLLISVTIFIAQTLNIAPMESVKTIETDYSVVSYHDIQQIQAEKPPLIHSPQWLNLSPAIKPVLQFFTPIKTYFVLSALLFMFYISQLFCYVFYPKQQPDFVVFPRILARCFKKIVPPLNAFCVSIFQIHLHKPPIFWQVFVRPKFLNP
jgi:hydrogenase/urease accessory protein HupE